MDVNLVRRSVYDLPSNQRVGAIVYDGAADMRLWPGPGPDTDLREAWGGRGFGDALATELANHGKKRLDIGEMIRVIPGRLHCDFLLWIATRDPEPGTEREPAPGASLLTRAVKDALHFVAARNVTRVAFGALGGGPGELDRAERLALVIRAARAYEEECFAKQQSTVVEEVVVCEPLGAVYRSAQAKVGRMARASEPERPAVAAAERPPARRKAARSSSGGSRKRGPEKALLTPDEVAAARSSAEPYSMRRSYAVGDYLSHPKFGIGRVVAAEPDRMSVLLEDGSTKQLVHGRA